MLVSRSTRTVAQSRLAGESSVKLSFQQPLGACTLDAPDLFAAFKHDHGRNSHDPQLCHPLRVFVSVDLGDRHLALILTGQLFQNRSNGATGTTPGRPKIYHNRNIGFQYFLLKIGIANCNWLSHQKPPRARPERSHVRNSGYPPRVCTYYTPPSSPVK